MVIFGLAQEPSVGADDDGVELIERYVYVEYSVLDARKCLGRKWREVGYLFFLFSICVGCHRAFFQTRVLDDDMASFGRFGFDVKNYEDLGCAWELTQEQRYAILLFLIPSFLLFIHLNLLCIPQLEHHSTPPLPSHILTLHFLPTFDIYWGCDC